MAESIIIKGAKLVWRNFSGKEGKFNPAGNRNFCVLLPPDIADRLQKDGWNVRWLNPREEGDDPQAYIQVAVSYKYRPPKIWLVTTHGKTKLEEDGIDILDWAEIANADVRIRPREYDVNGKSGIKAYCDSLFVTIVEDELDDLYSNVPDSASNSIHCDHCSHCGECDKAREIMEEEIPFK